MSLSLAALALAASGLLVEPPRARAGTLLGALLLGVAAGLDSLLAGPSDAALADMVAGLQAARHGVGGLIFVALAVAGFASPRWPTLLVVAAVLWLAWPILSLPPVGWTVGATAAVVAIVLLGSVVVGALRPGRLLLALDRALLDPRGRAGWRPPDDWTPGAWVLVAAVATILALVVPHLAAVLGGALVALIAAFVASRRASSTAWGLLLAVPALVLMLLWTLQLSGPLGGWIPILVDGPFSPRAARLLAALSAVVVAVAAGLWPLHGAGVPVLLAPVAVAVGGVFATALVPDGVQWWQPLAAPVAVLATGHAVAAGRPASALTGVGVFGLWTGTASGALGGAVLVLCGWIVWLAPSTWVARLPWAPQLLRGAWMLPAAGLLAVLRAGMQGELAYTLVLAAVAATGIAKLHRVDSAVAPRL